MKIIKKIRQHWRWATNYTVVFVAPNGKYVKQYIVHHRIFRKPIMRTEERREGLRGQSISMLIFDEFSNEPYKEEK